MILSVNIPIKSYLKKYILAKYKGAIPLFVSKRYLLGKLIIKTFSEANNKPKETFNFTETLHIVFDHQFELNISAGNVFDFNSLLEDIYRKDLATFISYDELFNLDSERKQAILLFNSRFDITEEDIAVETLIKHIQRHIEDTHIFEYQNYKKLS